MARAKSPGKKRVGVGRPSGGAPPDEAKRDLRAELLGSTAVLLRERGLAFVSLRAVARRANVSHGAPAYHFGSKTGLLTSFAAHGYRGLVDTVARTLAEVGPDARDRLQAIGCAYVRFAIAEPEAFAIMFRPELHELGNAELAQASNAAIALLAGTVASCVEQGYLAPERVGVAQAAAWSISHGFAELWRLGRLRARTKEPDLDKLNRDVHELFVRAILPDVAPRRSAPKKKPAKG